MFSLHLYFHMIILNQCDLLIKRQKNLHTYATQLSCCKIQYLVVVVVVLQNAVINAVINLLCCLFKKATLW